MPSITDQRVIERFGAHGLQCIMVVNPFGGLNGYVQLPEGHSFVAERSHLENLKMHGGLTYGPDEDRWIGFDTLHAYDMWDGKRYGPDEMYELMQKLQSTVMNSPHTIHWNEEMVRTECRRIAFQIRYYLSLPPRSG